MFFSTKQEFEKEIRKLICQKPRISASQMRSEIVEQAIRHSMQQSSIIFLSNLTEARKIFMNHPLFRQEAFYRFENIESRKKITFTTGIRIYLISNDCQYAEYLSAKTGCLVFADPEIVETNLNLFENPDDWIKNYLRLPESE